MHSQAFYKSILGKELIKNCTLIALFEEYMKKIPKQNLGIYISENQPWELVLIHAWKSGGHGTLVGAPHNTLRYWDLRHHFDSRTYTNFDIVKYPMPNFLAINSPIALKNLTCSGYPRNKLIEVEGLRYLYLLNEKEKNKSINFFTILICADYQEKNTIKILDWLSSIKKYLPINMKIVFRPHPIYKVNIKKYVALNLIVSENQLLQDFSSADVVIAGLISSVAADAYDYGLPVIQILDGTLLNMSPLRSFKNVNFVSSREELINILIQNKQNKTNNDKFFYLDKNLDKWKNLIDIKDEL
jgi:surface carbohydrate biosynthesis protein (TIGR04326 family)